MAGRLQVRNNVGGGARGEMPWYRCTVVIVESLHRAVDDNAIIEGVN